MADRLDDLINDVRQHVAGLGFELVDLRRRGSPKRVSLQIRIDRPDSRPGHGVTADDCALVSRQLESWLDASGILGPRYVLEVSSPGIERPIRWREHWERFAGHEVNVRVSGRGRIRATIVAVVDGPAVVLRLHDGDGEELTVPLTDTQDATLVVDWSLVGQSVAGNRK